MVFPLQILFCQSAVRAGLCHKQIFHVFQTPCVGVGGSVDKVIYTWSKVTGDSQCVGVAFLCSLDGDDSAITLTEEYGEWAWVTRDEFEEYSLFDMFRNELHHRIQSDYNRRICLFDFFKTRISLR